MSTRRLAVLALLAVLAIAAVLYTRTPVIEPPPAAGEVFLPSLADQVNNVSAVRVRTGGGHLVAELVRDADGWRAVNRWDYPADTATLRAVLITLAEARRLDERTADPEAYHRLHVDDVDAEAARGVELHVELPGESLAVIIGRTDPAGRGTFARRPGEPRAWLVSGRIERFDRLDDWLDDRLIDLPVTRVRAVDIEPANGEPVHVRSERRGSDDFVIANAPAGATLLTPTIGRSIARVVTDLRLEDVAPFGRLTEARSEALTRFHTWDGLQIELEAVTAGVDGGVEAAAARGEYVLLRAAAGPDADSAVREEAAALNARWRGWAYRIPEFKLTNATYSLARVLDPRDGS